MTVLLVDRRDRLRMTFTGEKAKEALGGLVTNDVAALAAGHGQRAVALTAKGRVISLLRVVDRGGDLFVDCEPETGAAFLAMIRKYVNPRLAKYADISATTGCLGVHGAGAAHAIAALVATTPADLEALPPFGLWRNADAGVDVIRTVDLSLPGFDLVAEPARLSALEDALLAQGARRAEASEVEAARIEAGLPRFGVEMDGETLPQEANLDALDAISFTKGCYTGQEVVARIHFRGHVNRHLRWLTSAEPLPVGAAVLDAEGKGVGDVRSSTRSVARGPLAIAMVRREVAPGSAVRVRFGEQETTARVEAIP